METTKTCTRCQVEKPVEAFTLDGKRRIRTCKECRAEHWRLVHADKKMNAVLVAENRAFTKLMAGWKLPKGLHQ